MDLLTHAALGAAGAAAIAPASRLRLAAAAGAFAALLPDADILIGSASDPLLNLEFHRHFSHSLAFAPFGAAIAALVVWWLQRSRAPFASIYLYCLVGYLLAPLLDACTSYGTHLLWPFAERPVAWNIVSVVDPLVTLGIVVPMLVAIRHRRRTWAAVALGLAATALTAGWLQHERAESLARSTAASRGHAPERLLVKPTLGNLVLWRSVYVHQSRIHVDAVRVGLSGRVYAGESAPLLDPAHDLDLPADSRARADLVRFERFADALIVRHPARPDMIGDARYSMLPTSIEPLWGIVVDASAPERAPSFETTRRWSPEIRARYVDMLLGR
jgi:inner membrane protein